MGSSAWTTLSGQKPGLRIPTISANTYAGDDEKVEGGQALYNRRLKTAIEQGYKQACKELGKEIDFGLHGLEICCYFQSACDDFKNAKSASAAPAPAYPPAPKLPEAPKLLGKTAKEVFKKAWRYVYGKASKEEATDPATAEQRAFLRDELSKMVLDEGGDKMQLLQEMLQGSRQNDATELLGYLLEAVTDPKIATVDSVVYTGSDGTEKTSEPKTEDQHEIKVPIAGDKNSFSDLLGEMQKAETLNGDNKYKRPGDEAFVDAKKTIKLQPKSDKDELVFSLKRFESQSDGRTTKISTDITLNEIQLDVLAKGSGAESTKKQKYEPTAFIVHRGSNPNSGHYTTFIKEVDGENGSAWFEYNDSARKKVTELDEEGLPNAAKKAYVVKYSPLADDAEGTELSKGTAKYKSGLPKSQSHGTKNGGSMGGNQCFANAAFAFLLSMTSLGRGVDRSQKLPDLQSLIDKKASESKLAANPAGETPKDSTANILLNALLDFQNYSDQAADKQPTLENILGAIKDAKEKDIEEADKVLLEQQMQTSQALLNNAANVYLASLTEDKSDEEGNIILRTYDFFADKNNPKFSLEVLSAIKKSEDSKKEFCQDPSAFIIKNTKWKCVDERKDFQATPSTTIQVTYCKPFAPKTLLIGTKSITQHWKTTSADRVIVQRANNFRAASIYDLRKGGENSEAVKGKEEIIQTHLDVILLAANEAKKSDDKSLSHKEVLEVIKFAKENGGVLNTQKPGAQQAENWMVDFSRIYQDKMKESGIFTGRKGAYKAVGSRLTFLPADVLEKIQKEEFKGKFAGKAKTEAVKEATRRIADKAEKMGGVTRKTGAGR